MEGNDEMWSLSFPPWRVGDHRGRVRELISPRFENPSIWRRETGRTGRRRFGRPLIFKGLELAD